MAGCGVITPEGAPPAPDQVGAATWLLADLDSGEVLAAKNPHGRHRPASMIKVLTALVTIRELNLDAPIVATQADADQEGSKVGLEPGVSYTVRQVLTGLIMQSGNDAAHALAVRIGGVETMVTKMNQLAAKLGARDTRAATPSGLDGPGMSISAYDMALIFRAAMRHKEFAVAAATEHTILPGEPALEVPNDNRVLLNYPGALGGKTGFTDDARHTYTAAAERSGRRLVAVLLRGENKPIKLSGQTMRLLDYGFGLPKNTSVGTLNEEQKTTTADAAHSEDEDSATAPDPAAKSTMFGTVGGPLTLATAAGIVLVGVLALRSRRAKLAAASRRNSAKLPDDHP